jgi:hypothetical protein
MTEVESDLESSYEDWCACAKLEQLVGSYLMAKNDLASADDRDLAEALSDTSDTSAAAQSAPKSGRITSAHGPGTLGRQTWEGREHGRPAGRQRVI